MFDWWGTSRARVLIRQLPDHSLAHRAVNGRLSTRLNPRGQISLAPKAVVRAMDALKENSDAAESSSLAPLSTRMSVTAFCSKFADSRLFGQASPRGRLQNLGTASLPNLNRMRHQDFHKSINCLLFATESRQFHNFIIITMILPFSHDSAIRWEEVSGVI